MASLPQYGKQRIAAEIFNVLQFENSNSYTKLSDKENPWPLHYKT